MMLKKMKCAGLADVDVATLLNGWVEDGPDAVTEEDLDDLVEWYGENFKKSDMVIYRGLWFKNSPPLKAYFRNGEISLADDDEYESWTVDPKRGAAFAHTEVFGFMLSRELKKSDPYLDVNKSLSYLRDKGFKDLVTIHERECEILTLPVCFDCDLENEVEFLIVNNDTYFQLIDIFKQGKWKIDFDEMDSSFRWKRVYVRFAEGQIFPYQDLGQVLKDLRRKPTEKC